MATGRTVGGRDHVDFRVDLGKRLFQHDHGKNTRAGADTLPVRGATLFVAAMPVPASPSGGQNGTPGCKTPVGSSSCAPSGGQRARVLTGGAAPVGSSSRKVHGIAPPCRHLRRRCPACRRRTSPVALSMGNMPLASPTPSTLRPVSCQCTYPASVVRKSTLRHVLLPVEHGLVQVRYAPPLGNVEAERRRSAPPPPGRSSCCARCGRRPADCPPASKGR